MYICCFLTFIGIITIIYTTKYISGMCRIRETATGTSKEEQRIYQQLSLLFRSPIVSNNLSMRRLSPLSKEQYSWSFFLLLCSSCQHSVSGLLRYVLGRYCLLLLMLVQYYISFFLLLFLLQSVSTDKYYTDNTTISYRYNTIKNKEDNRT